MSEGTSTPEPRSSHGERDTPTRSAPDHVVLVGKAIAGERTAGAHVALCLCGYAGDEHDDRLDAVAEGLAHVDLEQPIPYTLVVTS